MTPPETDVVIIGAGISGLACTHRLKQLGARVILLEHSDRAGGVIRSRRSDGFLLEYGPNSCRGTPELLDLVDELELESELIEGDPRAPAMVYFNGALRAVPMSPLAFLRSSLLSPHAKLRVLMEPFIKPSRMEGEESVESFVSRRLGAEIANRLVGPFVSGIYAGDPARLSIQAAFPGLAEFESTNGSLFRGGIAAALSARRARSAGTGVRRTRRSCSFRSGMQVLTDRLASRIGDDLVTECGRIRINRVDSSRVRVEFGRNGHEEIETRALVIAAPAWHCASMVEPVSAELSELVGSIQYPPLAVLHLAFDRQSISRALEGFGFLTAPGSDLTVLGCVFSSSMFPGRAPADKVLLTVFVGGALHPEAVARTDAEIASQVQAELIGILGITGAPRILEITRYDRAIPQYNLGHAKRVARIEQIVAELENVILLGNYLRGVSVGDCVANAEKAARAIVQTGHPA